MKVNCLRLLFFVALMAIALTSCRKNLPACKGNCGNAHVSGILMDKALNQPISNAQVKITLYQKNYCILCSSYNVAETRSQNNGHYDINFDFDTTLLKTYYLNVDVATAAS